MRRGFPFCGTGQLSPDFAPPFFQADGRGEYLGAPGHIDVFDLAVGVRVVCEIPDGIDAVVLDENVSEPVGALHAAARMLCDAEPHELVNLVVAHHTKITHYLFIRSLILDGELADVP